MCTGCGDNKAYLVSRMSELLTIVVSRLTSDSG